MQIGSQLFRLLVDIMFRGRLGPEILTQAATHQLGPLGGTCVYVEQPLNR